MLMKRSARFTHEKFSKESDLFNIGFNNLYLRPLVGAVVVDTLVVITKDGDGGGSVLGPGADGDDGQN
jgi:hypothetical protein